jgi:hypothetical protein
VRRSLLCAVMLVAASLFGLSALAEPGQAPAGPQRAGADSTVQLRLLEAGSTYLLPAIARHQRATWRWQRLMGVARTPSSGTARRSRVAEYRQWVHALWRRRAVRVRHTAANPPRKAAWLCIHRHEGAWNDPGAPYYGGLQMDISFQRAYGADLLRRKGTADNWTAVEQMWVAERAYRSGRGFSPWPNTARSCGVL